MLLSFIREIEEAISSSSIIVTSNIQKFFGPSNKEVYITGKLTFIDLSCLEFSLYLRSNRKKITTDKYRYQYMTPANSLVFRYDNAPHHKEIPSFPMHKHLGDKVLEAAIPIIKDVLEEISTIIIQSMN